MFMGAKSRTQQPKRSHQRRGGSSKPAGSKAKPCRGEQSAGGVMMQEGVIHSRDTSQLEHVFLAMPLEFAPAPSPTLSHKPCLKILI